MKKIILIFVLSIHSIIGYSQNYGEIDTVKIYLLEWSAKRKFGIGAHQIKEYYDHYFETNLINTLNAMFYDYDDFTQKLEQGKGINDYSKIGLLNALVEIHFSDKSMGSIVFDINGNYYYNEKWYEIHSDLYFILFKYFSNKIIPEKILKQTKENYKGGTW